MGGGRELSTVASQSYLLSSDLCISPREVWYLHMPGIPPVPNMGAEPEGRQRCALRPRQLRRAGTRQSPTLSHALGGRCLHSCLVPQGRQPPPLFRLREGQSNGMPLGAKPCLVAGVILPHLCLFTLNLQTWSSWDGAV